MGLVTRLVCMPAHAVPFRRRGYFCGSIQKEGVFFVKRGYTFQEEG